MLVDGQIEANIDGMEHKSFFFVDGWSDQNGVVDESGRPNEHGGQLIAKSLLRILDNFVVRRRYRFLTLLLSIWNLYLVDVAHRIKVYFKLLK